MSTMVKDTIRPSIWNAGILVVDDEAANVKLLRLTLQAAGYTNILSTQDPRVVTALILNNPVDLILLDLKMPHLDGFEVMERLQQLGIDLPPVLVLTAYQARQMRMRALKSGARDFLTKPFDLEELEARVRNLLELRLYHRSLQDQNTLLEERVRERTRKLTETRLEIVRRLARAAEFRDLATGQHIERMSRICSLLGRTAGMSEAESDLLLYASPMHDIGKIGIPDHILKKKGVLTPEEREVMQHHTSIGAAILENSDSEIIEMARVIVLTHHERWDGTGYPQGLKGDQIPLVGRISALADVFDALTSARPYKKPWSSEEAMAWIQAKSGVHFDLELVGHLSARLPDVLAIRDRFSS
jgi:putative two-component system response regulator